MWFWVSMKDSGAGQCQMMLVTCLGNLFGAISNPQILPSSAGPGFAQEGQSCTVRLAFTCTWPGGGLA